MGTRAPHRYLVIVVITVSLDPGLSLVGEIEDFETPTVHPTHFIRMGWNSYIWKEGPPKFHASKS